MFTIVDNALKKFVENMFLQNIKNNETDYYKDIFCDKEIPFSLIITDENFINVSLIDKCITNESIINNKAVERLEQISPDIYSYSFNVGNDIKKYTLENSICLHCKKNVYNNEIKYILSWIIDNNLYYSIFCKECVNYKED